MTPIEFLHDFLFDGATISSSSQVSTLPDDNVVHDFVAKKWRTTGCSSEWVKFDLGSAMRIKRIAIFGHNLTSGATITLEANTIDDWTSPPLSKGLVWFTGPIVEGLDNLYRWWRLVFTNAGNPDGYIEIGRICAGDHFEPTINYRDGWRRERIDPSEKEKTAGQQVYAKLKEKFWRYQLHFEDLPEADQDGFETLFEAVGNTGYIVVMPDLDDHRSEWTIYGQMTTPLGWVMQCLDYGTLDAVFEEQF